MKKQTRVHLGEKDTVSLHPSMIADYTLVFSPSRTDDRVSIEMSRYQAVQLFNLLKKEGFDK